MTQKNLYVLDCENEPSVEGEYRIYCMDNFHFRFYTLKGFRSKMSVGDTLDYDYSLSYSFSPTSEGSRANLPLVIRRILADLEMYIIENYKCSNFRVTVVVSTEIENAVASYYDDIDDFRDLSAVLQTDVVDHLASKFLEKYGVEDNIGTTDRYWNPDGSSDFEFAEKLNGAGNPLRAADFYSRSLRRGFHGAVEYLSSDFLKGLHDGLMDEESYRRCLIINHVSDGNDPLATYRLARHLEESLRADPSFKGASATRIVDLYKKAQNGGIVEASYRLGHIHQHGLGKMSPNMQKAIRAYRRCGDNANAWFKLASCYESTFDHVSRKGEGGIDAKGICELYRASAEAGNRYARNRLSFDTSSGIDPMLFTEARLPAYAGDRFASYVLAQCYETGIAGEVSYDKAIQWYGLIIESSVDGEPLFSDTICYVDDLPELYSHDIMFRIGELYEVTILKEYHLALEWYSRAAESGNRRARELMDITDMDSIPPEECMRRLMLRSEEGDVHVLREISERYEKGVGTKRDPAKALEFRGRLAHEGDPESQLWLASSLERKARTQSDMEEALMWYRRASDNGNVTAKERLDISDMGNVPDTQWFDRYRLFMYVDDPVIQYRLGHCYEFGLGVSTSYSLAKRHYQNARVLGSREAEERLDKSRIMSASGHERYRGLMVISDDPDPEVHYEIGRMYADGDSVERSDSLAYDWFSSAANLGHIPSAIRCADLILSGAVNHDQSVALTYYRIAADSGDTDSSVMLGLLLTEPGSDPKHHPEAVRRLRMAAHDGNPEARYLLGRMFEKGLGMPRFYAEAYKWYSLAADAGYFDAKYRMMLLLNAGRGTGKDKGRAKSILDELKSTDSGRLIRLIDSFVRGKDRLTMEFKAEHL